MLFDSSSHRRFPGSRSRAGKWCLSRHLRCGWAALGLFSLLTAGSLGATDPRIVERYRQMVSANPADESALDRLWKIAQADGFTQQLLDDFAKPAAKGDRASQLVFAQLLHRARRTGDAREAFMRAIALDPGNPAPHVAFAGVLPPKEAALELEKAVALQPKQGAASLVSLLEKLGETWLTAGQSAKAAETWEKTVTAAPGNVEPHRRLAAFYVEQGASASAARHLDWLDKHGDAETRANALRTLARLHQASGDIPAALAALEKAMALTAADNWLRGELVAEVIRLSRRGNSLSELEARWKKEAEANPRLSAPWLQLATLYDQQGNVAAERAVLERVVPLAPTDSTLKIRLARLLVQTDDFAGAAAQLDAAIATRKTAGQGVADLVFERAELDIRRNDPAAARTRLEALLLGAADEALAVRVVEFFRRYRMLDAVEKQLRKSGSDPAALADFLFSQHRQDEGRAVLRKLVRPSDPPNVRAEAHERVAGLLKQAGETVAALAELREAARLQPESRRIQLVLGDAILAAGDPKLAPGTAGKAAREVYGKAFELSQTEDERAEADLRMFRSFERETPPPEISGSDSDARRAASELLSVPTGTSTPLQSLALREFIESIEKQAMHSEGVVGARAWLRLARWQFWNHDAETAQAAVSQAISLAPKFTAPREFAVTIALGAGDRNGAIAQLHQLAKAAPDRKNEFLLQVARIQTQMGQHDEAIKTLTELARGDVPGAAVELANAQQQADRWKDALVTWEKIYGTAKKERRREFLSPLIRVMQRLQLHQRASEILWSAFTEQTEEPGRSTVLHDLIAHCREHGMTNWLLEKLQVRASVSGDPADAMALGTALKADGRLNEASKQMEGAARASANPAAAEADLVREAELRRDFAEAATHQRARLNLMQASAPADWERLATLQEAALDYAAADATREEILRRFPRDSDTLLGCAAYFEKWGRPERALKIVRAVRGFDPANVAAAATLCRLLGDASPGLPRRTREATDAAETILAKTPGGIPSDSLTLPPLPATATERLQSYLSTFASGGGTVSVFDSETGASSEREWRLLAIRYLSAGLDGAARQRWIIRWQDAAAASEKLWALYHVGARKELFQFLSGLAARVPGNMDRRFALIWCALRTGAWKELSDWAAQPDRTGDELEAFQSALGEWCAMGDEGRIAADVRAPKRTPSEWDDLFEKAAPSLLWPCAQVLANHHRFSLAATLGQRAFEHSPAPRGLNGLALANWLLVIGDMNRARSVLTACAAEPADSLDAPAFAALRALHLLAPPQERAAWTEKALATFRPGSHSGSAPASPIYNALATALLNALTGNESATNTALDRLLTLRFGSVNEGTSAERVWNFLLSTGTQFQRWHLDNAAAYFWRRALADEAAIQLQGDRAVAFAAEIRLRLAGIKLTRATAAETPGCIAELNRDIPGADLTRLAEFLQESGHLADAERVLEEAQKADTKTFLPRLLAASAALPDPATAERAIQLWLDSSETGVVSTQAVLEYLAAVNPPRTGEFADAIAKRGSGDPRVLEPLARLERKLERWDAAERSLRKLISLQPGNVECRFSLAAVLAKLDRFKAAADVLKDAPRRVPELDARRAEYLAAAGEFDAAKILIGEVLGSRAVLPSQSGEDNEKPSALQRIATAFAEHGRSADGLALLAAGVESALEAHQPRAAFLLQRELLRLLGPGPDDGKVQLPSAPALLRARWLRRLTTLAGSRAELQTAYYELTLDSRWQPSSQRRDELLADWDEGHGSAVAGAWIVTELLEARQPQNADRVLDLLLPRTDLLEPFLTWLDERAKRANRHELALRITETLAKRNAAEPDYAIRRARSLHAIGRETEAADLLVRAAWRTVFAPEIAGPIALAAVQCGNLPQAHALLEAAVCADPAAQQSAVHFAYARALILGGDFHAAKRILQNACRTPAAQDAAAIADYLRQCGRPAAAELRDLAPLPALRKEIERKLSEK